jgi:hypothetical protein
MALIVRQMHLVVFTPHPALSSNSISKITAEVMNNCKKRRCVDKSTIDKARSGVTNNSQLQVFGRLCCKIDHTNQILIQIS